MPKRNFFSELKRRNVYRIGVVYVVAAWLILQVAAIFFPAFEAPAWLMKGLILVIAIGFPIVLILAWIFELTPDGLKKTENLTEDDLEPIFEKKKKKDLNKITIGALSIIIILLLVSNFWQSVEKNVLLIGNTKSDFYEQSIAVLPFVNMSSDKNYEYFADGLSEELINLFVKIPNLKVTSRSSAFSFKDKQKTIPEIGEILGVTHILEGSVRKSGDNVRITVQLIRVSDETTLLSETWDKKFTDIFAIQDEIASTVYASLELKLEQEYIPTITETSPEAFALFLEAKYLIHKQSADAFDKAEILLKKVLDIDSNYVPAWDYLSQVYERQTAYGIKDAAEGLKLTRNATNYALKLDSNYIAAYFGLMQIQLTYNWDLDSVQYFIDKVKRLDPNNGDLFGAEATLAFSQGNMEKAITLFEENLTYDPVAPNTFMQIGMAYYYLGDYKLSQKYLNKTLALSPDFFGANFFMGNTYLFENKLDQALDSFNKESFEGYQLMGQSLVTFKQKKLSKSDKIVAKLIMDFEFMMPFQIAEIYGFRGEINKAFEWLDKAYEYRDGGLLQMINDPMLQSLTNDPRWNAFLIKMKFLNNEDIVFQSAEIESILEINIFVN